MEASTIYTALLKVVSTDKPQEVKARQFKTFANRLGSTVILYDTLIKYMNTLVAAAALSQAITAELSTNMDHLVAEARRSGVNDTLAHLKTYLLFGELDMGIYDAVKSISDQAEA